jgi:hypothetical protein
VGHHGYDCYCLILPLVYGGGGGYTGTASDNIPFQLQDVNLYSHGRHLDMLTASAVDLGVATLMSYTFTTQKNGHRNEKVVQGSSGDSLCCPVKATIRRVRHHWAHGAKQTVPIAAYYRGT